MFANDGLKKLKKQHLRMGGRQRDPQAFKKGACGFVRSELDGVGIQLLTDRINQEESDITSDAS